MSHKIDLKVEYTNKMAQENEALRAQVEQYKIALAERKAVCHKAFDANDAQAAMIDELKAQVQQFKKLLIRVAKSDEYIIDDDLAIAVCSDLASEISEALDSTPAQCLAEIKAQAVEEFCASSEALALNQCPTSDECSEDMVVGWKAGNVDCRMTGRKYANQLRQAAKDGE